MKDFTPEARTRAYYDAISRGYKELYHEEQKQKLAELDSFLPRQGWILDLGGGDGVLHEMLECDSLITCDISLNMLRRNPNDKKVVGSMYSLPFMSETFDHIISLTAIQDLHEPLSGVHEICRVLRHDGTLVLSFLKQSSRRYDILTSVQEHLEIVEEFEGEKDMFLIAKKR